MDLPKSVLQAIADADTAQQEAWLNIEHEICGIKIRQMTIKDFYFLNGVESPFLKGGDFTPGDIGIFLWLLSPDYKPCKTAQRKFVKQIKDIKVARAEEEILKYLEITFCDMDTLSDDDKGKRQTTFLAYQIDLYSKEYGWSIEEILKMPLRQVFQLNTAIAERYARQQGKQYSRMRQVDMLEAKAILDMAKQRQNYNN